MKLRNLFFSLLAGSALFITSCEECEHEGDRSIASSLQVGDVVCSDGSVLSKEKFSSSKKEPVAIVYHVNRNPEIKALGYAVSIRNVAPKAFTDSLGVEQETSASLEKEDGNENTHAMYRNEEVKSPLAVYVFDMWRYGQSAYIPSVKQLTYLYQQIGLVNQRIESVGGLPISLQPGDCWLWTSSEVEGQREYPSRDRALPGPWWSSSAMPISFPRRTMWCI